MRLQERSFLIILPPVVSKELNKHRRFPLGLDLFWLCDLGKLNQKAPILAQWRYAASRGRNMNVQISVSLHQSFPSISSLLGSGPLWGCPKAASPHASSLCECRAPGMRGSVCRSRIENRVPLNPFENDGLGFFRDRNSLFPPF